MGKNLPTETATKFFQLPELERKKGKHSHSLTGNLEAELFPIPDLSATYMLMSPRDQGGRQMKEVF